MPWLGFLLLLVGLATAAPQAVDTVVAPDDVDSTDDNTKFNLSTLASLPGDKLNFWTAKEPPSAKVKPEDNLIFEFLHCSGIWRNEKERAEGDCNYVAGEVARGCQLHLLMKGTRSVTGTCKLEHNMQFSKGQLTPGTTLANGLCYYGISETNDEMVLVN